MEKKYIVIGTSNSIVRGGWFDGFNEFSNSQVDRVALGGAPFTQFFSRLQSIVFEDYDLVILECSPNDESYSDKIGFSWFFDTLYQAFIAFLTQKCELVVLRVPAQPFLKDQSKVWQRQKKIIENLGAQTYDMSASLITIANAKNMQANDIYRDKYHPKADLMCEAGKIFSNWVVSSINNDFSKSRIAAPFEIFVQKVRSENTALISNNLIEESFEVLTVGESYKFPKPGFCLGFFIAAEYAWSCLALHGLDGSVQHTFVYFEPEKNKGQMKFVPIKNGYYLRAISLVHPYKLIEYPLHSNVPLGGSNQIAFGDFVFIDSINE